MNKNNFLKPHLGQFYNSFQKNINKEFISKYLSKLGPINFKICESFEMYMRRNEAIYLNDSHPFNTLVKTDVYNEKDIKKKKLKYRNVLTIENLKEYFEKINQELALYLERPVRRYVRDCTEKAIKSNNYDSAGTNSSWFFIDEKTMFKRDKLEISEEEINEAATEIATTLDHYIICAFLDLVYKPLETKMKERASKIFKTSQSVKDYINDLKRYRVIYPRELEKVIYDELHNTIKDIFLAQ